MKKILLSVVCLVVMGIQSVQAQVAIAALHHNNAVTIYAAAQIQTAIDAAEPGDTLYLGEGMFGGFTVTKPIVIIGAGRTTTISSETKLGESSTTLQAGLVLSGLNFLQNVIFNGNLDGIRLTQCKINGNCRFTHTSSESFNNIEIMMSQITTLDLYAGSVKGLTVVSSKINTVDGSGETNGSVTFQNCNISNITNTTYDYNNYVGCIIVTIRHGVYQNCLYTSAPQTPVLYDCYQSSGFTLDDDLNCSLTDEELKAAGYVAPNDTWVGITGGSVPFTLVMPVMQVTEHSLVLDQAEKKLRVNLKLGNK